MRFAFFYHSLLSDWNHGNAHFLRGVATELLARGHQVRIFEPAGAWSLRNLVRDHGTAAIRSFRQVYPGLRSHRYSSNLDLDWALEGIDVVLVHEWNDPSLVARLGAHRARVRDYRLFFHDTHHRAVTAPDQMRSYDLRHYDGVLAFGAVIRDIYLHRNWTQRAWTWHEAADVRVFTPRHAEVESDLVWVGNWGDDERASELREYLLGPVIDLGLRSTVHGVRYPVQAKRALSAAGIQYRGWLPNYRVPHVFARHKVTVHVPRRPYATALPGIPTIRPFEALACGIPLVSSPWEDCERLFRPGEDFLIAKNRKHMRQTLREVLEDHELGETLARNGRRTIMKWHTCSHRVDELLHIYHGLNTSPSSRLAL